MATTCPKCNSTDLSSEKYYLNPETGAKTVLVSGKKDSSIIAVAVLLLGLVLLSLGIFTLPLLFSSSSGFGTILLGIVGGGALTWSGGNTLRKNLLLSKQSLRTGYTCKSCNHAWQEEDRSPKKPVYLSLLPIGAGLFSCLLIGALAIRLDTNMLMLMLLVAIVLSAVVAYLTNQWIQKNFK